jgi:hypothetical protein
VPIYEMHECAEKPVRLLGVLSDKLLVKKITAVKTATIRYSG